jgi:hypothetical protein
VIVGPDGKMIAGPVREREETLIADLDLRQVAIGGTDGHRTSDEPADGRP